MSKSEFSRSVSVKAEFQTSIPIPDAMSDFDAVQMAGTSIPDAINDGLGMRAFKASQISVSSQVKSRDGVSLAADSTTTTKKEDLQPVVFKAEPAWEFMWTGLRWILAIGAIAMTALSILDFLAKLFHFGR